MPGTGAAPQHKNERNYCWGVLVRLLLFTLAFNYCNTASAQSFYYYVYEPAKGQEVTVYKTLLTVYPDGTAMARVQYNAGEQHELFLYELKLIDSGADITGSATRYLMESGSSVPLLEEDSAGFLSPRFMFKKTRDSSGYYFEPGAVELKVGDQWTPAKVITIETKTGGDLRNDEPFVSSFYFDTDLFYQQIFEERRRANPAPRSEKLFLFVVANTEDSTIGESAKTDLQNVSRLFTTLARDAGITKVLPVYIAGSGYSKEAVEMSLRKLEAQAPSPNDIVIFYYSGHGFRLQGDTSKFPRMSFRTAKNKIKKEVGENISLEDVYNRIVALKPKLTLVLGDCCNADIFENPVLGNDMIRPKGGGVLGNFSTESATKLFFPPAPMAIIIGSVKQGHLSVGHPDLGGYFTHFFTVQLEKALWGYYSNTLGSFQGKSASSWGSILVNAGKETFAKSLRKQCGLTERDRCIQQAEFRVAAPKL